METLRRGPPSAIRIESWPWNSRGNSLSSRFNMRCGAPVGVYLQRKLQGALSYGSSDPCSPSRMRCLTNDCTPLLAARASTCVRSLTVPSFFSNVGAEGASYPWKRRALLPSLCRLSQLFRMAPNMHRRSVYRELVPSPRWS